MTAFARALGFLAEAIEQDWRGWLDANVRSACDVMCELASTSFLHPELVDSPRILDNLWTI